MSTTIEAPRPEATPYTWPTQDLKNLVQLAPMSPYTRALLRIKFNRPVPDACTTFEQIEAWLATLPTLQTIHRDAPWRDAPWRSPADRLEQYIEVEATDYGTETQYVSWSRNGKVRVPLSIWEEGIDEVKAYVEESMEDFDRDYGDTDYGNSETDSIEIEDDLDELMREAERMIRERDGVEEDDDD